VWHFQTSHHDIWDYDPPASPILADVRINGRERKALIQVTKQAFCFVLDRVTGEPIWRVEERPVPSSDAPRERTAATQPFPVAPPAFDRQGELALDQIIDFTPELRREAEAMLAKYKVGPLFTPPSLLGTVSLPGSQDGASWSGAAWDAASGMLYVPSVTRPTVIRLASG
jgi:quinoprotein glucose dehydrogenase